MNQKQRKLTELPLVGTSIYYVYKDLNTDLDIWTKGVVVQSCPHFLPPSIWVKSKEGDTRYLKITELGLCWWLIPIQCWKDVYELWEKSLSIT